MKRIVFLLAILFSFGLSSYGQPCPPGEAPCGPDHICKPTIQCKGGPPPPGLVLPIDSNIYFLLAAGFGLGIYFLGFAGKKIPTSSSELSE